MGYREIIPGRQLRGTRKGCAMNVLLKQEQVRVNAYVVESVRGQLSTRREFLDAVADRVEEYKGTFARAIINAGETGPDFFEQSVKSANGGITAFQGIAAVLSDLGEPGDYLTIGEVMNGLRFSEGPLSQYAACILSVGGTPKDVAHKIRAFSVGP